MTEAIAIHRLYAGVDRLILEEHRLDPFELLMALELLDYVDYEAWRGGRRAEVLSAVRVPAAEAVHLLDQAGDYARGQGLVPVELAHRGWGGEGRTLSPGTDQAFARALSLAWEPAPDRHQLDLFHDGSTALLENEIRAALAGRREEAARRSLAKLMQQEPGYANLRSYLRLIEALGDQAGPSAGKGSANARLAELESIDALAHRLLGRRARDLMDPLWSAFAESRVGQRFDSSAPELHPAAIWRRCGRWQQVREAVQAEPGWRDRARLVLVHVEASRRTRDLAAAMTDWMWLCWEHPEAAEEALGAGALGDLTLAGHWQGFLDLDPDLPVEDFPAWLLLREPGLASVVAPELVPGDERGEPYRLLRRMVCEDDDIATRRALSEVHPELLRLYLGRRV